MTIIRKVANARILNTQHIYCVIKYKLYVMPDRVGITVITKISLRCHIGLERLLNAFEKVKKFTPTHWGLDERAPNPYNHDELIATVSTLKSNFYLPGLHRRQVPRYQAYFSATNEDLNYVLVAICIRQCFIWLRQTTQVSTVLI